MSTAELTTEEYDNIVETAEQHDVEVRSDYSGRGMYGATCLAFTCDDERQAIKVMIGLARLDDGLAEELADCYRTDQLGLGIVVYFPGVEVMNEEVDA